MTAAVAVVSAAVLAGGVLLWRRRCLSLVAQASHELRGPLQAALLGLHALEGSGDRARLAAIELELRRAARAVDDLSAAVSGRRPGECAGELELGELLADAGVAWELLAAHRGVGLVVEPAASPLVVHADGLRIAQALANLVANAVEHGAGEVRVRARMANGRARVEVTDGGPGLPAPLPDLVAAARGRRGRHGHGLALASAIARRHGGRLVTAPSPRGARLVLELPLVDAVPAGRQRAAPRGRLAALRRVRRRPERLGRRSAEPTVLPRPRRRRISPRAVLRAR